MLHDNKRLQIGDIVRLKSGGPDMKVVAPEVEVVHVEWVADDGSLQLSMFATTSVHKVEVQNGPIST